MKSLIHMYDSLTSQLGLESAEDMKVKVDGRPVNFGTVIPGVYRSGYPQTEDYEYLKTLGLKTVL